MSEKPREYWRWREYRHTEPNVNWRDAKIVSAGVDVGSVGSKATVMLDGKLFSYAAMRTGGVSEETAAKAINWALEGTGLRSEDVHYIVGTGYGRVGPSQAVQLTFLHFLDSRVSWLHFQRREAVRSGREILPGTRAFHLPTRRVYWSQRDGLRHVRAGRSRRRQASPA